MSAEIAKRYQVQHDLAVLVGADGNIAITTNGFDHAGIGNVAGLCSTLETAKRYRDAVFPPAEPGRPDQRHTWQERSEAFGALDATGILTMVHPEMRPDQMVTRCLDDWKISGKISPGRYGGIAAFAPRWAMMQP